MLLSTPPRPSPGSPARASAAPESSPKKRRLQESDAPSFDDDLDFEDNVSTKAAESSSSSSLYSGSSPSSANVMSVSDISDLTGRVLGRDELFRATFTEKAMLYRILAVCKSVVEEGHVSLSRLDNGVGLLVIEVIDSQQVLMGRASVDCHVQRHADDECGTVDKPFEFLIPLRDLGQWVNLQNNSNYVDMVCMRNAPEEIRFISYNPEDDLLSESTYTESTHDGMLNTRLKPFPTLVPIELDIDELRQIVQSCSIGKSADIGVLVQRANLSDQDLGAMGTAASFNCIITTFTGYGDTGAERTRRRMLSMTNVSTSGEIDVDPLNDIDQAAVVIQTDSAQTRGADNAARRRRADIISRCPLTTLIKMRFCINYFETLLKSIDRGTVRLYLGEHTPIIFRFSLGNAYSYMHFALAPRVVDDDE